MDPDEEDLREPNGFESCLYARRTYIILETDVPVGILRRRVDDTAMFAFPEAPGSAIVRDFSVQPGPHQAGDTG